MTQFKGKRLVDMKKFSSILLFVLLFASLSIIFLISILSKNNFTMQTTSTRSFIAYLLDDVSASDDVIFITEKTEEVRAKNVLTKIIANTTKKTTTKAKKNNDLVEKDGNVADKYVKKVDKQLNKLPDKVVKKFKSSGWTIAVTDKNLAKTYFNGVYSSVRGVTIYSQKTILIEDRDAAVDNSPLHEMGHYVDFISGMASKTSEFKSIYKEECNTFKKNIPNASSVRDEMEFFATIFCYYYKDSAKCTPKAKAYVEQIIANL
jgi:hypothetical protein